MTSSLASKSLEFIDFEGLAQILPKAFFIGGRVIVSSRVQDGPVKDSP